LLIRAKGETPVRFRAAVPQEEMLPALIGRFVKNVLGGSAEPLLAYFGNSRKLSAKDLEALKAIARRLQGKEEPKRPQNENCKMKIEK